MVDRSGVETERGAPVVLEHRDRHLQPAAGVPVGLVVVDVNASGGAVVGHDRGHRPAGRRPGRRRGRRHRPRGTRQPQRWRWGDAPKGRPERLVQVGHRGLHALAPRLGLPDEPKRPGQGPGGPRSHRSPPAGRRHRSRWPTGSAHVARREELGLIQSDRGGDPDPGRVVDEGLAPVVHRPRAHRRRTGRARMPPQARRAPTPSHRAQTTTVIHPNLRPTT